jgi:hypothetical protein
MANTILDLNSFAEIDWVKNSIQVISNCTVAQMPTYSAGNWWKGYK